ncbi:hypothetical protein SDC9_94131 [bioreactor metagenome]|uniref:Uncharacterized protein n=1 Tax=bioreactor metagenome TaxID=1076179 RepID=A0A645A590_9ZZZZ
MKGEFPIVEVDASVCRGPNVVTCVLIDVRAVDIIHGIEQVGCECILLSKIPYTIHLCRAFVLVMNAVFRLVSGRNVVGVSIMKQGLCIDITDLGCYFFELGRGRAEYKLVLCSYEDVLLIIFRGQAKSSASGKSQILVAYQVLGVERGKVGEFLLVVDRSMYFINLGIFSEFRCTTSVIIGIGIMGSDVTNAYH